MSLKEIIKQNGGAVALNRGSIKVAEGMLLPNETVLYATTTNVSALPIGAMLTANPLKVSGKQPGVFIVTSLRVLFCQSVLGSGTTKQILISEISSVDDATQLMLGSVVRICGLTEMFVVDCSKKALLSIRQVISNAQTQF